MEQKNLFDAVEMPSTAEIQTEVDVAERNKTKPDAVESDKVGCCHRYRECSQARRCLAAEGKIAEKCAYREHLKEGRVFYGRDANGFDKKHYAEIEQRIKTLPDGAKTTFDEMVIAFHEYNRGARSQIIRSEYAEGLADIGVFDLSSAGYQLVQKCSYQYFLKIVLRDIPAYREAARAAKGKKGEADFCRRWLEKEGREIREKLAEPYRCATEKPNERKYLEEYYVTHLLEGYDTRVYSLSPFAADGLLSPAEFEKEQTSRRRQSRGYSSEALDEQENDLSARTQETIERIRMSHQEGVFPGRVFVITGTLEKMERKQALCEIEKRGGNTADTPVERMNYLICGEAEWSRSNNGLATRKIQKAVKLLEEGRDIAIISEKEFYELLALPSWNDLVKG